MIEECNIRGIEDIEEIEKVPLTDRIKEKSTLEILERGAAIDPDATAISFLMNGDSYTKPLRVSYHEFMGKIRQTANMLNGIGIGPEDVVTYILPNIPQTHYVLWGAEAAGIANPINPLLEPDTIRDICIAAGTKAIVALGEQSGSDIWQKIIKIRKDIPSLQHTISVMGSGDTDSDIIKYDEQIENYPSDRLSFNRNISPNDIASLYHTGGTTGTPKLARRTHFNEIIMSWDLIAMTSISPQSTLLCGLPLFHCNGTLVTGLAPFSIGAQVVLLSPMGYRDTTIITNFYEIVDYYNAELFSSVPTVLSVLLDTPVGNSNISSLKYAICGAAPLSVELFKKFEAHSGIKIIEGYGLTEGAVASALNPKNGVRKIGSVGIRMPYQQIKTIVMNEDGQFLRNAGIDEIGTVAIKGPNVFKGYVEEVHNRGIWLDDGFFNTGDLGRIDKDGYVWLTGRKKDVIIRGGHNIDPASIEEPLYKIPGIKLVAAIGRPDAHAGEVPVAYVEVAEDSKLTETEILEWARENIGEKAAVPKQVIITQQIPLTPVGKIFKPALRWKAIERVFEKELQHLDDVIESYSIEVAEHKIHGTIVMIQVVPGRGISFESVKERIQKKLARYTIYTKIIKRR